MGTTDERRWMVYVISDEVHCEECETCNGPGDPDSSPGAFAYTAGLHALGLPELQVWARPGLGDDPGDDWRLSPRDLHHLLNDLATRAVDGLLRPGDEVVEIYDGGRARVVLHVGAPVGRDAAEAYRAHADALVTPVRWSLEREPAGDLGPVAADVLDAMAAVLTDLHRAPVAPVLDAWWSDRTVCWAPDQRYGPLTPLVRAHAIRLLGAGADEMAALLVEMSCGRHAGASVGWVMAQVVATARTVGRQPAVLRLRDDVLPLVDSAMSHPAAPRWDDVVADVCAALGETQPELARAGLAELWREGVLAALATSAVLDVADTELECAGLGPVRWAACAWPDGPARHVASDAVHDAVRGVLRGPEQWLAAVDVHVRALQDPAYEDAMATLQGRRVVAPVAPGPIDRVIGVREQVALGRLGLLGAAEQLSGAWVSVVACGAELPPHVREAACAPFDAVAPRLRVAVSAAAADVAS